LAQRKAITLRDGRHLDSAAHYATASGIPADRGLTEPAKTHTIYVSDVGSALPRFVRRLSV
jgi:hypothetical protein